MSRRRLPLTAGLATALLLAGAAGMVAAQTEGERNPGPSDSGSFEVPGVEVDVKGASAEAARMGGWRLAQRKGWEMLAQKLTGKKSSLPDSTLDGLVTGIVVDREQIGPTRYIARLGVMFDRNKAAAILGVSAALRRSAPMLLLPVEWSGGAGRVYERETAWRTAWARFRGGNSAIDYVRPRGGRSDALLVNAGQVGRRGRGWWRNILDQYGAADVLVAEVNLRREYPGGPVTGVFTASHGPDKIQLGRFALRVESGEALDALLDAGIQRIDQLYQDAFARGALERDRLLGVRPPTEKPKEEEAAEGEEVPTPTPGAADTGATFTVQVETPSVAAVNASEAAVRAIPGVRSAATTSLALGGISVMRVGYDGTLASLRAALEARGWSVQEGPGVLRIRRPGGGGESSPPPAEAPSDE